MTGIIEFGKWLLPTLSLLTAIGIGLFFLHVLFFRKGFFYEAYQENKDKLLWFAFAVALTATSGSLFYSEIVGWPPCTLCWVQRAFMYPLVPILGIIALRKSNSFGFVLPMAVVGGFVSAIQYPQQFIADLHLTDCSALGGPDCATYYTLSYGFITIPMMALIGFIAIGILVFLKKKE